MLLLNNFLVVPGTDEITAVLFEGVHIEFHIRNYYSLTMIYITQVFITLNEKLC
jgi:hypothetical protein